jgi:hypothetical protein
MLGWQSIVRLGVGFALCAATSCAWLGPFCTFGPHPGEPLPTVEGPEDPSLVADTHGTLIAIDRQDPTHIEATSLPTLVRSRFAIAREAMSISGPDLAGRVAYLERHQGDPEGYSIRILSLATGEDSAVLDRQGALNPASEIAIAPSGGWIAFTSSIDRSHSYDYTPWSLELVDPSSGRLTNVPGDIAQHRPLWFPDGRRLAFVATRAEDRASITFILDVLTGERRVVRAGTSAGHVRGISADGRALWFGDGDRLIRVDAETGALLQDGIDPPGRSGRTSADPTSSWTIVGELPGGKLLYDALPTTGAEQQLVSGVVHGAKWTIKLCDPGCTRFVTVVPHVWGAVAYGTFDLPTTTH